MLPFSRNTDYVPGTLVKSFDLDDIQDQIVANNRLLTGQTPGSIAIVGDIAATGNVTANRIRHGDQTLVVTAAGFMPRTPLSPSGPLGPQAGWTQFQSPSNEDVFAWLPLPVGARVRSIVWRVNKNGIANASQFSLVKFNNASDGGNAVNTLLVSAATVGAADYPSTPINYDVEPATGLQLLANVTNPAITFLRATVTFDKPS